MKIGYACINMELGGSCDKTFQQTGKRCGLCHKCLGGKAKSKVFTNRTCIKRTFEIDSVAEKIENNLQDLLQILAWNEAKGIRFMRLSSEMFPFMSHDELGYTLAELPNAHRVQELLTEIGNFATTHAHRLTYHPGPFNVLGSKNPNTVRRTVKDLETHGAIFDAMGFEPSHYNKINIHLGVGAGDHDNAIARFVKNFALLSPSVQQRLTLENDDKARMFSVKDLFIVSEQLGVPIVFDYHHHKFCTGGLSEEEALKLAVSTWGDVKPVVHFSESRGMEQGLGKETPAHSDLCYGPVKLYGLDVDIMIEAKFKELSIETLEVLP